MLSKHPTTELHPKPFTVLIFVRVVVGSRAWPKCVRSGDELPWYKRLHFLFPFQGALCLTWSLLGTSNHVDYIGVFSHLTEAF